jgi:hypothetical protein
MEKRSRDELQHNMDNENTYQYHSLEHQSSIRVLQLYSNTTRLECSISQVNLSGGGYQALSYEWGPRDTSSHIHVQDDEDGGETMIPLTTNLYNALRNLRDADAVQPKLFWIDQISINQHDNVEKGRQVNLMCDIYRNAKRVITYLGPHSSDIELEYRALDLLGRLSHHFKPNYPYFGSGTGIFDHAIDTSALPVREMPHDISEEDVAWPALIHIVYGSWLRRLWMVQENVLCPVTVMLRGTREFEWLSVASIVILFRLDLIPMQILIDEWTSLGLRGRNSSATKRMLGTWVRRWQYVYSQSSEFELASLLENLTSYSLLDCKDPRDRIYALLGISSDIERINIVPNYEVSPQELYLDFSTRIYLKEQDLNLFAVISGNAVGDGIDNLPSWSYRGLPSNETAGTVDWQNPHPVFCARLRFEEQNRVMVARGRVVAKIRFVSADSEQALADLYSFSDIEVDNCLLVLHTIVILLEEIRYSPEMLSSLINNLIADRTWEQSGERVSVAFWIWSVCRFLVTELISWLGDTFRRNPKFHGLTSLPLQNLRPLIIGSEESGLGEGWSDLTDEEYEIAVQIVPRIVLCDNSIALSEENQCFKAVRGTRKGDVIALLEGGDLAYVLRPVGHRYRYIGNAYAHDFRDEKAYEGIDPADVDEEIRII